jgi:hypothetical protein
MSITDGHIRCNPVQGATASLASTATLASWNLQLTDSKEMDPANMHAPMLPRIKPVPMSSVARPSTNRMMPDGDARNGSVENESSPY